jgi:prepilin-type N-terminal cleavage/methylation domain-containing protein
MMAARADAGARSATRGATRVERRGFTLLEAVVALAIIGLVCVGVLGAYGATLRADVVAVDRLPLAALAEERIAAVDLAPGSLERLPDSLARGIFTAPYASATWDTEVRRVRGATSLYDVTVRVRDGTDVFTLRTRRARAAVSPMEGAP